MKAVYKIISKSLILAAVLLVAVSGCNWATDPDENECTLDFNPSPAIIGGIGESTDVDVIVNNANGLITARISISFNPNFLEVEGITAQGSDFLFTDAGADINVLESTYDNESGMIVIGIGAVKADFKGATGSGKLATLKLKGLKEGYGFLSLVDFDATDTFMGAYSDGSAGGWKRIEAIPNLGTVRVQKEEPPVSPSEPPPGE